MKKKSKEPFIPVERHETIRQKIISVLEGRTLSAKDISADVRISEKEIYEHLEHIQRTLNKSEHIFILAPAVCRKCSFVSGRGTGLKNRGNVLCAEVN